MIGITELALIVVVAAIFFFGKDKVIEWARTFGEAKKEYAKAVTEPKKKSK